jgi:hypothetical protein
MPETAYGRIDPGMPGRAAILDGEGIGGKKPVQ